MCMFHNVFSKFLFLFYRLHNEELIRRIKALLKELGLKIPGDSTLRKLLKRIPAGHSRDIQGIDNTYEFHRRAFNCLNKIVCSLYDVIKRKRDNSLLQMVEKIQTALSQSSKYILGHFSYNLGYHEKCVSHCINFGCSNPKDENQREECQNPSPESHDEKHDCDYCNLLPSIIYHLERVVEECKEELNDITYREMVHDIKKSFEDIQFYKRQVMRNTVSASAWEEKFKECSMHLDLITGWCKSCWIFGLAYYLSDLCNLHLYISFVNLFSSHCHFDSSQIFRFQLFYHVSSQSGWLTFQF